MTLTRISDRIYYLPAESETDRPCLGYVRGNNFSLAVDAGNSLSHVTKFYDALKEAALPPPDFTAITHWHWDHTFGMHAVSGRTVCGHATNEKLKTVSAWGWSDREMKERIASGAHIESCDRHIRQEFPDRDKIRVVTADIEFTGSLVLDLGGIHCELREIVSPHTDDSVLAFIPEARTVFVGDAICRDYYRNGGYYDRQKLENLIGTLRGIDFDILMLGHGEPQAKKEIIAYLEDELAEA